MTNIFESRSKPWLSETPRIRRGQPSVFKLREWLEIRMRPSTRQTDLDQCQFVDYPPKLEDEIYTKGTSIIGDMPLEGIHRCCGHPIQEWIMPSTGKVTRAPHPPLFGSERAHKIGEAPRSISSSGEFLTRATAHYPAELTWQMIALLIVAGHDRSCHGLIPGYRCQHPQRCRHRHLTLCCSPAPSRNQHQCRLRRTTLAGLR